ncbi:MAG TPA: methyltransferase domain-containing protein, partial [Steroidobacteraceae bacterium]|nr:methyltransferase domain-containing protein [Steroidobacteraceae bacterium]
MSAIETNNGRLQKCHANKVQHAIPQDLRGWTALDIGCNAGFYSLEFAKRGARVKAVDVEPLYLDQARWVVKQYGMQDLIEVMEGHVYELVNSEERFDFVWFTGVFYHLKYPALALDLIRRATRRMMIFQTMTMPGEDVIDAPADLPLDQREAMQADGWPKMAFIEQKSRTTRRTGGHRIACVEALLRAA